MNENEISFYVKGSSEEPYKVIFVQRSENNLSAYCSCTAGEMICIANIALIS